MRRLRVVIGSLALLSLLSCAKPPASQTLRLVSLSPDLTEAIFAIGAGDKLVGVSDYCNYPAEAATRPRVGTGLTPGLEKIVRLQPSHVLTGSFASSRAPELGQLARLMEFPWLTLEQVTASLQQLGELTKRQRAAEALAAQLNQTLNIEEPKAGRRVLLLIGDPGAGDLFFIKPNSLHGRALWAAGAKNAVVGPVKGPPSLSLEQLVRLDPDAIIVLQAKKDQGLALVRKLSGIEALRAAKEGSVSALTAPEAFSTGPRIIQLVAKLRAGLERGRE